MAKENKKSLFSLPVVVWLLRVVVGATFIISGWAKSVDPWGFIYKTVAFVWVKRNRKSEGWFWGLGGWTRSNAEICLLAVKGKPKRISASVHQIIDSPIEAHSKKPELAREKIIELLGEGHQN